MAADEEETILIIVDAETREAYRRGEGPKDSGPLFFTTREHLEAFADDEGIDEYTIHEVPAGILSRMKGKPHWVDGKQR
ncbi:MAG: hypothetical protein K0Q72_3988 [Armatimonadetes bacterium]|jgi:hypothetical protein|nr:hypothetical protein [Armatimonadota bacterium]